MRLIDANIILRYLPLFIAGVIASTPLIRKLYDRLSEKKYFAPLEIAAAAASLILCTASLVSDAYNPFLYFKF